MIIILITALKKMESTLVKEIKVLVLQRHPGQMLDLVTLIMNVKRFALNLFTGLYFWILSINVDNLAFCRIHLLTAHLRCFPLVSLSFDDLFLEGSFLGMCSLWVFPQTMPKLCVRDTHDTYANHCASLWHIVKKMPPHSLRILPCLQKAKLVVVTNVNFSLKRSLRCTWRTHRIH